MENNYNKRIEEMKLFLANADSEQVNKFIDCFAREDYKTINIIIKEFAKKTFNSEKMNVNDSSIPSSISMNFIGEETHSRTR